MFLFIYMPPYVVNYIFTNFEKPKTVGVCIY